MSTISTSLHAQVIAEAEARGGYHQLYRGLEKAFDRCIDWFQYSTAQLVYARTVDVSFYEQCAENGQFGTVDGHLPEHRYYSAILSILSIAPNLLDQVESGPRDPDSYLED